MRRRLKGYAVPILAVVLPMTGSLPALAEENGFYVKNGRMLECNGSDFIARGINYPYAWFAGNWNSSVTAIAALGANCIGVACPSIPRLVPVQRRGKRGITPHHLHAGA